MIRNALIFVLSKGFLHGALFLFVLSCPFSTDASDTLVQIASVQGSPPSAEIEASKRRMEQSLSLKTREQLYQETFGISPPKPPRQVEASLTVNEKVDGKIEVIFSDDRTDFTIPASPVLSMITEMVSSTLIESVKAKMDKSGRLTKKHLNELRMETTFDSQDYLVHISIPPDLLSKQVHDLKGYRDDPYVIESVKPNATSAYLNAHVNQKLKYIQSLSSDTTSVYYKLSKKSNTEIRQSAYGNFDGAINIKGVVLEGNGSYREKDIHPIQRKDVRLVYDLPKKLLRFTAGDIIYKTAGYLSYVPIGGIGIAKDYSLMPNVASFPVSEREFFLSEPSEVEVWVNNVMVKSMVLESGTHDIRGFPFASGSNNVRIEIKDFSGRAETLEFFYIYEPTLLCKGISQYAYNVGFPSTVTRNEYTYDTKNPHFLLTYKRGLTNNLTFDIYGQSSMSRTILGTEGIYAHSLGNLHLTLAGSYDKTAGPDFAAQLGFFYRSKVSYSKDKCSKPFLQSRVNPITWNTQVEYLGSNFPKRFQDTVRSYEKGIHISTNFSIPMPGQFNVGLKSTYNIRLDSVDVFGLSVSFQKTLFKSLRAGANLTYSSDIEFNRANPSISVNAQWSFMAGPNSFFVNETVTKQPPPPTDTFGVPSANNRQWGFNTDLQWDYIDMNPRPEKIIGGIVARVGEDYSEYNGRLGYNGNGGSIEFNQNLAEPGFSRGKFIQHQSDLTLKTALVFVDGIVGFSTPVYGGFVIAKGVKNLKGCKIRLNPNDAGYDATSTWFSPAVLPVASPYQLQKIGISPLNYSVASVSEKMAFTLFPQYKSGFLLTVGTDKTVLVIGTLLDQKRNPFGYESITITLKGDKKIEPIKTFTNQAGKFQFMGKAGLTYELYLGGLTTTEKPIDIFIPKDKNDYYRVGELYIDGTEPHNMESSDTSVSNNSSAQDSSTTEPSMADSVQQGILKREFESELENTNDSTDSTDRTESDNKLMKWDLAQDDAVIDTVTIDAEDVIKDGIAKNLVDPKARRAYVLGTLRGPQGVLPFTVFDVFPVNDSLQKSIRSFTNKDGKFQIICNKPANYRISAVLPLKGDTVLGTATFYLPAKSMGVFRQVGNVTLTTDQDASQTALPSKDNSILVTGILTDRDNQPIQYTPLFFTSLDETKNTFTGKDGSFQMICRNPGRYIINISESKYGTGSFITIPAGTKGHYDVGSIHQALETPVDKNMEK